MLYVCDLGLKDYVPVYQKMQKQVEQRAQGLLHDARDEIWFLQHNAVFTQGQAGKPEHILNASEIPIVQTDRGGQVTYHGPGQIIAYFLLDLSTLKLGTRELVTHTENSLIHCLKQFDVDAYAKASAPGVYVNDKKIASLGFRIKKGLSYHGLALNVDMDLEPFQRINPCGFAKMQMTQLVAETSAQVTIKHAQKVLANSIEKTFNLPMIEA